ncbi:hypothetical protein VOLCADRAFT_91335 [Volvox carteri f. nagariensis]|uniref:Uncharacterized protein n=1 Tax=Volvox carteri f. nagariensis TaxID=3068 RepID=D8TWT1_VOLCA|nr:uncharacterized protein VOLCADRAFT_91335 [Volvox carteri f. nagariensis]EFJ48102.1 hypothetical protein VOLCADRAFT_91335 [Volvox carteri f. nagariensis]|eukprot:XP_002950787.1 hypothetical protein VOLCADRAFT_91335 [Volvox carteri f. nagariensis]
MNLTGPDTGQGLLPSPNGVCVRACPRASNITAQAARMQSGVVNATATWFRGVMGAANRNGSGNTNGRGSGGGAGGSEDAGGGDALRQEDQDMEDEYGTSLPLASAPSAEVLEEAQVCAACPTGKEPARPSASSEVRLRAFSRQQPDDSNGAPASASTSASSPAVQQQQAAAPHPHTPFLPANTRLGR